MEARVNTIILTKSNSDTMSCVPENCTQIVMYVYKSVIFVVHYLGNLLNLSKIHIQKTNSVLITVI